MAVPNVERKSRWFSPEFLVYYVYACWFYVALTWRATRLTAEYEDDKWRPWLRGLGPGWIPGRSHIDVTDSQWRNFREGLPLLTVVMGALTGLSVILRNFAASRGWHSKVLECYWLVASLAYVAYLHGTCVLFILAFSGANFVLVKGLGASPFLPPVLWAFNCATFVCTRVFDGFSFASFGSSFVFLDEHRGVFRWQICFNLVMLRMVSFGLDHHWMCSQRPSMLQKDHARRCRICQSGATCYAVRQEIALPEERYSWTAYLGYLLFAPLYIAGPILTFNAYASQMAVPQQALSSRQVSLYAVRWLACLLLMELISHFCFFPAIATSGLWQQMEPLDICITGYGVTNVHSEFQKWTLVLMPPVSSALTSTFRSRTTHNSGL